MGMGMGMGMGGGHQPPAHIIDSSSPANDRNFKGVV